MFTFHRSAVLACGLLACTPASAADLDASYLLSHIPLIVLGDMSDSTTNHIESLTYVGGNYTSGLLATNTDDLPDATLNGYAGGMFVGGDLTVQNGINGGHGAIVVGGTASYSGSAPADAPVIAGVGTGATGIPVVEMADLFTSLAADLGALETTSGASLDMSNSNSPTLISGAGVDGVAILNLDESAALSLFGNQNADIKFDIAANVSLIVNVMIEELTVLAKINTTATDVLFNFYTATTLSLGAGPFNTSLLAPNAAVVSPNSGSFGSLVAGSLTMNGEIRPFADAYGYIGDLPPSVLVAADVPVPAAVWAMIGGLGALAAASRRRRVA